MKTLKYLGVISISVLLFAGCNWGTKKQPTEGQQKTEAVPDNTIPGTPTEKIHLETYVNSVYRYHIGYPDKLLIPQGESDSGDGQVFTSKDNLCELRVYRDSRDILHEGAILKKSFREDMSALNKDSISNSEITDSYYIIEGKNNNEYFHQKSLLRKDNLLITAIYAYKPEVSEVYKPTVSSIFNSMH